MEARGLEPRGMEPRVLEPRVLEARAMEARVMESRGLEPRGPGPNPRGPMAGGIQGPGPLNMGASGPQGPRQVQLCVADCALMVSCGLGPGEGYACNCWRWKASCRAVCPGSTKPALCSCICMAESRDPSVLIPSLVPIGS